jgi:hypothetical protein
VSILSPIDTISELIKKRKRNKEESLEKLQEYAHYRIESTINNKKIGDMAPFIQLFRFRFKKEIIEGIDDPNELLQIERELNNFVEQAKKYNPENPPILGYELLRYYPALDAHPIIPGFVIYANGQEGREYLERILKMDLIADFVDIHRLNDPQQELEELKRRLYELMDIIGKDEKREIVEVEGETELENLPNKEKYEYTSISLYRDPKDSISIYKVGGKWEVTLRIGKEQGLMKIQEQLLESHHIQPPSKENIKSYLFWS